MRRKPGTRIVYHAIFVRLRTSRVLLLALALVLVPGALVAHAKPGAGSKPTGTTSTSTTSGGIPGLPGAVGLEEVSNLKSLPGDPVAGLEVFRMFCAGCHNFKAAGLEGDNKPGSDLDHRKPTYAKIVTLIAQGGGGGAPSKQLLQELTFDQIYDVAKFVALYAGKPGPVKGAGAAATPPVPFELSAPLRTAGSKVAGSFSGTLADRALRWSVHVKGAATQPSKSTIRLVSADGKPVAPITLDCQRCIAPGTGFALLTKAQAAALANGRATLVVPGAGLPTGPLSGKIASRQ
jgi:mono/diheme cytochrome c family protein